LEDGNLYLRLQKMSHTIYAANGKGVGLPDNSYKSITNTAWVHARLCKLQKGCTRLAATSDKDYQLLAHGRWFSPGTPTSSTNKTGCHDIDCFTAE
jgi:hypothetical protein